jgi:hypothetical protein
MYSVMGSQGGLSNWVLRATCVHAHMPDQLASPILSLTNEVDPTYTLWACSTDCRWLQTCTVQNGIP